MQSSKNQINEIKHLTYELTIFLDNNSIGSDLFEVEIFETKVELYSYLLSEIRTDKSCYLICIQDEIYISEDILQLINFIEVATNFINKQNEFEQTQFLRINIAEQDSFEEAYNESKKIKKFREIYNIKN